MATQGQWQGQWAGQWSGATEPAPAGSMAGSAAMAFSATGDLTAGASGFMTGAAAFSLQAAGTLTATGVATVATQDFSGGDDGVSAFLIQQQSAATRIRKQNQAAIALILAAITEGILE